MKNILFFLGLAAMLNCMVLAEGNPKAVEKETKTVKDNQGILMEVELNKKTYEPRENIDIKITLTNNSGNEISIPFSKIYYKFAIIDLKRDGKEIDCFGITLFGQKALSAPFDEAVVITLKPSEKHISIYELDRIFDLSLESGYSFNCTVPYFINKDRYRAKIENIEFKIKSSDTKKSESNAK